MTTHTLGTTPEDVIRDALQKQCREGYCIDCREGGEDFRVLQAAVNQGIDSFLQAIVGMEESRGQDGRRSFTFDHTDMLVLLRRLFEMGAGGGELAEEAWSLRTGILSTLGIEEV